MGLQTELQLVVGQILNQRMDKRVPCQYFTMKIRAQRFSLSYILPALFSSLRFQAQRHGFGASGLPQLAIGSGALIAKGFQQWFVSLTEFS